MYARVSTLDPEPEKQLSELRRFVRTRGWTAAEYVDRITGAKSRRPALDALLRDARHRHIDVLVCWRLDRLGRNLRHLLRLIGELNALGIALVSLEEGIDATGDKGQQLMSILRAIQEFERERLRETVLVRLRRRGPNRRSRPKKPVPTERLAAVAHLPIADAAAALQVSRSTISRWRRIQRSLRSV